ncbi:unnamed protein product [Cuscuta epithymum]|uniref:Uncharacterized protein n=1 Tax=Cuscuta epithymum TaxID=186058 RepID=A0AAV0C0Z1_9ASTE|nr:unnamed protein product [Cuscuta epithymum]
MYVSEFYPRHSSSRLTHLICSLMSVKNLALMDGGCGYFLWKEDLSCSRESRQQQNEVETCITCLGLKSYALEELRTLILYV